jgi:uncharacterized protein YjdB
MARKKCIFFTAGAIPTTPEQALIDRLSVHYDVGVRNTLIDDVYGEKLESADAVAGTIPAAFTTAIADYPDGDVTPAAVAKPEAQLIVPATVSFAHTGTFQLYAVSAELDEAAATVALTNRTSGTGVVWSSSDATKATVADGLVTGVAAGSATITWTYTYATGKTVTATRSVTLT